MWKQTLNSEANNARVYFEGIWEKLMAKAHGI
jgi:hypothetical protein